MPEAFYKTDDTGNVDYFECKYCVFQNVDEDIVTEHEYDEE